MGAPLSLAGELWEAAKHQLYGTGPGHAHPCVEWVRCPVCGAAPGKLCFNAPGGPKLDTHYKRRDAYRLLTRRSRRSRSRRTWILGVTTGSGGAT